MATAISKTEITNVTLELSADEAKTLAALLVHVSGNRKTSPVKHAMSVLTALSDFNTFRNEYLDLVKAPMYGGAGVRFADFKADKGNS